MLILQEQQIHYFLKISLHLEIPRPSKCRRMFLPILPDKRCPQKSRCMIKGRLHYTCMYAHAHYMYILIEAVYMRACVSISSSVDAAFEI